MNWKLTLFACLIPLFVAGSQGVCGQEVFATESLSAPVLAGCEPDYPPFCIVTPDRQADGFSVELLRAALQSVGAAVEFKIAPWPELKQDLADGRLQVLPLVGRTPEREAIYDFTFPYLTMHGTLVVRADTLDIRGPADLQGRQVAVLQGDNAEEYLHRFDTGAIIVPLPTFETALRELSAGKYDAVVIQKLLAFQLMKQAGLENLRTVGPPLYKQNFCFATRKDNDSLLATLNEGLSIVMANGTFRRLHQEWFAKIEALGRAKSRMIIGGDSDYPPYEFLDGNGQPAGFNVDLTRAIARHLGLSIEIRLEAWGDIRKGLETGEIDAAQGMFYSVERDQAFDFSPPSTLVQHVIVVRTGSPKPIDLEDLAGRSILVMAGDIMEDLAEKQGLGSQRILAASQEEALQRLSEGEGDCALVAKVPALYWIHKNGWHNLEVVAPPVLVAEYCYAVPLGNQALISDLSQGLAALKSTGEYRQIQAKWLSPYEKLGVSIGKVVHIVLLAAVPLLALLLASILWSHSLRRQVAQRTEDLQQSNTFLDEIIENLPNMLFIKEAKTLRFIRVNQAGEKLMGHAREDMIDKSDYDFFPKEQADFFTKKDHEVLRNKAVVDIPEEPLLTPHNGERILHTHKVPILNKQGEPAYLLGISEDITEHKQAEAAHDQMRDRLTQAQKMESVGRLAGGVAHDSNNMLQAILGFTELALEKTAPSQPIHHNLMEIQKAAQRSADLTRQLLTFASKQPVAPQVLDMNANIEGLVGMLRQLIGEDINIIWRPGPETGSILADASQLAQILTNLCINARDAIAGTGTIAIETGTSTFDVVDSTPRFEIEPGEYVRLAVSDSGCGMTPEIRDHAFEPFYTTKGHMGTGLGLATIYGIVRQHKGFVHVYSEPDQGTTFKIFIPRHRGQAETSPQTLAEPPPPTGSETLLLVEDEPALLQMATVLLKGLGYAVLAAATPEHALHLAQTNPETIHLLITDVIMPGINGRDLSQQLQARSPSLRTLFMSGHTADIINRQGIIDNGLNFIQKPFSMKQMAVKVRQALDHA